jgi:hypothetical protein
MALSYRRLTPELKPPPGASDNGMKLKNDDERHVQGVRVE